MFSFIGDLQMNEGEDAKWDTVLKPTIGNQPAEIQKMIEATVNGLRVGIFPKKVGPEECSGGVYLMGDADGQRIISVFKPRDEEPHDSKNPREGLKSGTLVGEGATKEVAAYLLDHKGFAGVPATVMVTYLNPHRVSEQEGSLQMFMENMGSCEDFGPENFPTREVHKIAVFDIRLANADRHGGNFLRRTDAESGNIVLIPIDHGYCLPTNFADCSFYWLNWRQAKVPFDAETLEYISSLDADKDIKLLEEHRCELRDGCAKTLRISTRLLKKGAEKGLTPYEIGDMMVRKNKESEIEEIVREAQDSSLEAIYVSMDCHLDPVKKEG
ncbi:Phosphatidylinositol 4-kinase gamma 2 [Linum grandiflorum]